MGCPKALGQMLFFIEKTNPHSRPPRPKPFPSARRSQKDAAFARATPEPAARVKPNETIAQVCKGREAWRVKWRLGPCPPQPGSAGLAPAARPLSRSPRTQLTLTTYEKAAAAAAAGSAPYWRCEL